MTIWMVVKKTDPSEYAFGIGRTAAEAYRTTCELFGTGYTTDDLKKMGYKATKAEVLFV